jgi:uncharacterized protein YijF (DUF1287 family)
MRQNFAAYPKDWNLTNTDPNIDHRRAPKWEGLNASHGTVIDNYTFTSYSKDKV